MLDPQEVRKRRQEAIQQSKVKRQDMLMEEAQKIFQWILKLIDEDSKQGRCNSVAIWQYKDCNTIKASRDEQYGQCRFSIGEIMPIVCEIINHEEGYHAEYTEDAVYYDEDAWRLTVTVE